ncbi:MAG: hypothetical protein MRY32_06520 [Rickettsiales bacterium]|nr:hypothetical protein [Rickettsiales bacterium]
MSNSQEYKSCTALTRSDPSAALKMADSWSRKSNMASAYHCRAIALFALKRYSDAGQALDQLSTRIGENNLMLWANVLRQSAKAWKLSDNNAKAIIALTKAIHPVSNDGFDNPATARLATELLLERSGLYSEGGRELFALQDLDQALTMTPNHEKALLERAKLLLKMGEIGMAKDDANRILQRSPKNKEALQIQANNSKN